MKVNQYIDHTLLKPQATADDIIKVCQEAKQYEFFSVCVNPHYVALVNEKLADSPVKVCSVIGFPLGANKTALKAQEAAQAVADGADEIDMVINVGALRSGQYDFVEADIKAVVEAINGKALLKVIIETCLLTEEQKIKACQLSKAAGADFVKTSTGFSTGGATTADIALMRKTVGSEMGVKASGGIRDYETAVAMIEAGASRIGAGGSLQIIGVAKSEDNY